MSDFLSKEDILGFDDLKTIEIHVPEWGNKKVRIKTLSAKERDEFESSTVKMKNGKQEQNLENFRARFVALCLVDDQDRPLFANRFEIQALGGKSVKAVQRIFNAAQELNAMTEDDVEELTRDFEQDQEEASTSV